MTSKKTKKVKTTHPWRLWIPKKDRPDEQHKLDKIPSHARMGLRL